MLNLSFILPVLLFMFLGLKITPKEHRKVLVLVAMGVYFFFPFFTFIGVGLLNFLIFFTGAATGW